MDALPRGRDRAARPAYNPQHSERAHWNELVRTATESGASKVYTVHGNASFAARLLVMGIDAEHLADHPSITQLAENEPEPIEAGGAQLRLGLVGELGG